MMHHPFPADGAAHLAAGCDPVRLGDPLIGPVERFQRTPALRLLPVIDERGQPAGAIYERDMRRILFNPFGHALLKNPSFGGRLDSHVRPCPVVDSATAIGGLIDLYAAQADGCEGLIVTRDGAYAGVIDSSLLVRLTAERDEGEARRKAARYEWLADRSERFRQEVGELVAELVRTARALSDLSVDTAARADRNGRNAAAVAEAATRTAADLDLVAARGEELAATFATVDQPLEATHQAMRQTLDHAERGRAQAVALRDATGEIGTVVALIDDIARATAMLALNAGIEAARAGDAGQGFAVVAQQVKSLATQTRQAAAEIGRRIDHMSATVADVAAGHAHMDEAVRTVDRLSSIIFDAVARQGLFTRELAATAIGAGEAARGIQSSAGEIGGNAEAAAAGTRHIRAFAQTLAEGAQRLERHGDAFLEAVRTA